jgi:hypothetical protein
MFRSSACLTYLSALKMEVITLFETSIRQITRFTVSEDDILNIFFFTMSTLKTTSVVSGQGSGLELQRSGFDSRCCHILWEVVGLERGPLILVSTTEELFGRKSSGSVQENRDCRRSDPPCWPRGTLYPQELALTSLTSGGSSVGIVRSRSKATELLLFIYKYIKSPTITGICDN